MMVESPPIPSKTSCAAVPAASISPAAKVRGYIDGVLDGSIPAGELIRKAVQRHERDLKEGEARGLRFDDVAGARAIDFCGFVRHSKGEWGGEIFDPEPWECFILWCVFGWKRLDDKGKWVRRFRIAYCELPRKNGKSTLASIAGLELFIADGEPGAEIYTAATKRDQARIVHSEAVRMVKSSPALKSRIGVFKDNLNLGDRDPAAKFEPLGADSDTMDGLNIHGAIVDELHAHKDRSCWDVLETATGARRQALIFAITTAGSDKLTVCGETHDYCVEILKGIRDNDSIFAFIATIDEGDDWADPLVWAKANPNFGVSVKPDDLRAKAEKAKAMPSARNAFLRLHLNVWTETDEIWIPPEKWDLCRGDVDWNQVKGRPCIAGLDLGSKIDLTALVLLFKLDDGRYLPKPFFWLPDDRLRDRRGHDDYGQWVKDGFIETSPGAVTDYELVEQRIVELAKEYEIREIAYDPWNCTQTALRLRDQHGIPCVEFRQGIVSMNEPSKEFEKLVMSNGIIHDGNPVMRWMISNTSVYTDPAGNIKPVKPEHQSRKKIDGVVASIMALGRHITQAEEFFAVSVI